MLNWTKILPFFILRKLADKNDKITINGLVFNVLYINKKESILILNHDSNKQKLKQWDLTKPN